MGFTRLIIPTMQMAFGFFILWQGIDCLKVEHFGIRLLTIQWLAGITALSYHMAGIMACALGAVLIVAGAILCRRADKRIIVPNPDIAPPKPLVIAVLVAVLCAFAGSAIVDKWFTTGPG